MGKKWQVSSNDWRYFTIAVSDMKFCQKHVTQNRSFTLLQPITLDKSCRRSPVAKYLSNDDGNRAVSRGVILEKLNLNIFLRSHVIVLVTLLMAFIKSFLWAKHEDSTCVLSLREKCPNTELFLVRIQSECGKTRTRNISVCGHFTQCI